ncbi:unnamed protein product [Mytilus edulis]|uniref:Uncharacterized protein n=1 Tax=Mytilus edulis TaxID=6550 RepID=A0A8S3TYL8_MYTED|nr:unnamed protein product [Mytilus edulis]
MTPDTLSVNEYGQVQHTKNATTNGTKCNYFRRSSTSNTITIDKDATDNARTNYEQEQEAIYTAEPVPVTIQTQGKTDGVPADNSLIELFHRKLNDYIEESEELSGNEQDALNRNMKYANETIGTSASMERRQQISEHIINDIFMQCQGSSNYCGLCVVNNILGPDQHNNFPVTIEQMDELADNMWLNIANDPFSTPSFILPVLRDREGFYTIEVLLAALEHNDLTTVRLDPSIVNHSTIEEIWNSLKLYDKEAISLLIRYKTTAHYVAITWRGNCYRLIDSREPSASLISPTQMSCLIKLHCNHPGSIYLVQRNATSEEEYWERTFENQESPHTATETNGNRQNQYETNMEEDILDNMESQRHDMNTGTHQKDNTTEDVEEQTSDENDNGTEYMTNVENIMGERNYELRKNPTQSMEDILRNSDKKDDLQSDNEGSMKDMSTSSELEHDVVSDMSTSSELEHDVVSDIMSTSSELERCWSSDVEQPNERLVSYIKIFKNKLNNFIVIVLTATERQSDNQEIGGSEEEEEEDDIDDDFHWNLQILNDEADHERHHQFICNPETIYNKERKRVAFGFGVISNKIISALLKYLTEELVYNHQVPFRFGGRRIRKMKNIELNNIF